MISCQTLSVILVRIDQMLFAFLHLPTRAYCYSASNTPENVVVLSTKEANFTIVSNKGFDLDLVSQRLSLIF